jgi:MscS family membrane protein
LVEKLFLKFRYTRKHASEILKSLKKIFELLLVLINIEIAIYIYYDFVSSKSISMTFSIIYSIVFTIVLYKIVNKIASIKISKLDNQQTNIQASLINVGIKIINFVIFIIGVLLVLYNAGLNLTAVLSGLGIGGFAVALAAKDSLANFFGTLSILLGDTFRQGDWIVGAGVEGTVVEIGLRVTIVRTFDNALISVPNATLSNADIKNWNRRELGRRIKMSLGVKYDSSSEDIKSAVKDIREMLQNHSGIATENTKITRYSTLENKVISYEDSQGIKKTLLVYLDEFSDSSINILVYCFSKTVNWAEWLEVKEDVMHRIMEIFDKNNLEFAFPSMSIYKEN